jgi:ribosomal protein S18 acetylase RimI-like enzyme
VNDIRAVEQISVASAWSSVHFTQSELPRILRTRPGVGAFDAHQQLRAFVLATSVVPPGAWLGGFGVPWPERQRVAEWLDALWPMWEDLVRQRGATTIFYTGFDRDNDLLHDILLARGFRLHEWLRSYDKIGTDAPATGNQGVQIRPVSLARDLPALLAIEAGAFLPPWRHDATEFTEIAEEYPFFIVATSPAGEVLGYQFSSVDEEIGFLVRIAVRADQHGQGIGTRLMAEAMRYFAHAQVLRVLLNAEDDNSRAHRLYEWFGFTLIEPRGFVLARDIAPT